ncbi:MAG: lysylphosphatidylglycerol synthase transmembrane domain-containing protein [Chloroflexota bacterium]|jgi:uncharacterized protein (TIRG00374 family)
MKKHFWIGLAVSALFLFLMFRSLDLAAVGQALTKADFTYIVPALILFFSGVFFRSVRWSVLIRPIQPIGVRRLFVVMVVGFMANNILPLRAGEAVRTYMLWRKERLDPAATVGTIVVERIFDGLVLTGFLVATGLIMTLEGWLSQLAWVASIVFLFAVLFVFALTIIPSKAMALASWFCKPFPKRLQQIVLKLLSSFVDGLSVLRSVRDTVAVALLSIVAWLLEASMYFALMFSFPFKAQFLASILGTAVANLGTMVPSSPGYVGTFDLPLSAVMVGTFAIDPSLAASYTLLVHAALVLPVVLLGLLFVWRDGLSLARLTSREGYNPPGLRATPDRPEITPRRTAP